MLRFIKNIMYVKKEALLPTKYFQLEISKEKNVIKYIDNKYPETIKNPKIQKVEDNLVIEYLDNLFRIIRGWKSKYENTNVIDGTEWELQIIYKNNERKTYSGINDFPNNFEYLDKIKYDIINKRLENNI